ncbi:MAG TPA: hypothetical protein VF545_12710 [Thermoleophilaceae bacterium]
MSPLFAVTVAGVARAAAFALLLLLLALAARRWAVGRRDAVDAGAVAIVVAASMLVAAGLALSVVDGVTAVGWLVVLLAIDAALLAPRENRAHVRRALPAVLSIAAAAVAVGAIAHSRASAQDHDRTVRFTQLWAVPAGSLPATSARIGVRNLEGGPRSYRVVVTGMRRTFLDRTIELGASATWSASIQLPFTESPKRVTAELYRDGDVFAYRTAFVWTPILP